MDADLRRSLRDLQEDFSEANMDKHRVLLKRSGLANTQILANLLGTTNSIVKSLILEELGETTLSKAQFIVNDPALQVMADYRGHCVEKEGRQLKGRDYKSVYLTRDGIFEFELGHTRLFLRSEDRKIASYSESREFPMWDTRKEFQNGYLLYGEIALNYLNSLTKELI